MLQQMRCSPVTESEMAVHACFHHLLPSPWYLLFVRVDMLL